jgi:hypothetical protein
MKPALLCCLLLGCTPALPPVHGPLRPLERDPFLLPLGEGSHPFPGYPKSLRVRVPDNLQETSTGADGRGLPAIRTLELRSWEELDRATHLRHTLGLSGTLLPAASRLRGSRGQLTLTLSQVHHTLHLARGELRCSRSIVEDVRLEVDGGVALRSAQSRSLETLGGSCDAPVRGYRPPQWFSLGITTGAPACARIEVVRDERRVWEGYACGMKAPHQGFEPRRASGPVQRGDQVRLSQEQPEYCAGPGCSTRYRFANWHGVNPSNCPCTGTDACSFTVGDNAAYGCIATWEPVDAVLVR